MAEHGRHLRLVTETPTENLPAYYPVSNEFLESRHRLDEARARMDGRMLARLSCLKVILSPDDSDPLPPAA